MREPDNVSNENVRVRSLDQLILTEDRDWTETSPVDRHFEFAKKSMGDFMALVSPGSEFRDRRQGKIGCNHGASCNVEERTDSSSRKNLAFCMSGGIRAYRSFCNSLCVGTSDSPPIDGSFEGPKSAILVQRRPKVQNEVTDTRKHWQASHNPHGPYSPTTSAVKDALAAWGPKRQCDWMSDILVMLSEDARF
ncbi:hypothetical protein BKA93DRAFT_751789 [Sparassis latifolia]